MTDVTLDKAGEHLLTWDDVDMEFPVGVMFRTMVLTVAVLGFVATLCLGLPLV